MTQSFGDVVRLHKSALQQLFREHSIAGSASAHMGLGEVVSFGRAFNLSPALLTRVDLLRLGAEAAGAAAAGELRTAADTAAMVAKGAVRLDFRLTKCEPRTGETPQASSRNWRAGVNFR